MLLSVGITLNTQEVKCKSLNDKPYLVRPTLINVNDIELHYLPL